MVCQSSDVFQWMIILRVRALDTNNSKERTSERLTQIPLSRAKMKKMSRILLYYSYLDECLFSDLDPTHLKQTGLGFGSSRDVRTPSVFERQASRWLVMHHFKSQFLRLCPPC